MLRDLPLRELDTSRELLHAIDAEVDEPLGLGAFCLPDLTPLLAIDGEGKAL